VVALFKEEQQVRMDRLAGEPCIVGQVARELLATFHDYRTHRNRWSSQATIEQDEEIYTLRNTVKKWAVIAECYGMTKRSAQKAYHRHQERKRMRPD
jgi:hypothetical protein